ncbi:Uncharacterized protein involved in exopolysaccharide biosynthesis [Rhizobiales bacterium GAS191]|nr:Uncharacterized protein involved in exopolysaccharide biosynthesis [Rhizobiales bacterium GAS191]
MWRGAARDSIGAWPIRMSIPVQPRPVAEAPRSEANPAPNLAGTTDLRELSAHLGQRWRLIVSCLAAALLLAAGYLFVTPPQYLALASLLIDPQANGSLTADTGFSRGAPDTSVVENELKLVVADNVLRRVVDHENLISDPEFGPQPPGILSRLLTLLGRAPPSSDDPMTSAIGTLREHVFTRRSERTFVIDLGVYARDAKKSAHLTDALAQAFIEDQTAARVAIARQQSDEIRTRLASLKSQIEAAETRVEQYKTQHNIFDSDGKPLSAQQLNDSERDLAQAHLRVVDAKARLDQLRSSLAAGRDPAAVPEAMRSTAVERIKTQIADIIRQQANLRTTLGPRHPALLESENQLREARALLQMELTRIADGARNDYDIALANEAALQKRLAETRTKTSGINEAMVKMRELQRDVEVSHAIYDRFLKASGFVASDQLDTPTARVFSAAVVPTRPESPKRLAVLSIALAAGLGLGLGLALFGRSRSVYPASPQSGQETPRGGAAAAPAVAETRGSSGLAAKAEAAEVLAAKEETRAASVSQAEFATPVATDVTPAAAASPPAAPLVLKQVVTSPSVAASEQTARQDREAVPRAAPASGDAGERPAPVRPRESSQVPSKEVPSKEADVASRSFASSAAPPPDRFDIPALATAADAEASLTTRLRVARDNPQALLPHAREVELHPSSEFARVMRELRRALTAGTDARLLVVAIVSEMRGCGKSTLATNLARAFTDTGERVLILDADRRNASLTQAMGTDAPEGTIRLADAMRPVFALDGSWRAGIFLASLALGRAEPGRADARMPSFSGPKALTDVLIIDTQAGTRGPALGPDLPIDATLIIGPALQSPAKPLASPAFAHVRLVAGPGDLHSSAAPRRPATANA